MKIEFYFDFGSPNSYLSHLVIPKIEQRKKVKFDYIPILLGGVFKLTGNKSPAESLIGIKNKGEYAEIETNRFLKKNEINNYKFNPDFPINTLALMRGATFAKEKPYYHSYIKCIYQSMWEKPKKLDELSVFETVLKEYNLPSEEIIYGAQKKETKQMLIDKTSEAVEKGVFGSPTFFVENEIFFGKDRLEEVEREIEKRATEVAQV